MKTNKKFKIIPFLYNYTAKKSKLPVTQKNGINKKNCQMMPTVYIVIKSESAYLAPTTLSMTGYGTVGLQFHTVCEVLTLCCGIARHH